MNPAGLVLLYFRIGLVYGSRSSFVDELLDCLLSIAQHHDDSGLGVKRVFDTGITGL